MGEDGAENDNRIWRGWVEGLVRSKDSSSDLGEKEEHHHYRHCRNEGGSSMKE